jgi:hypothetical protein
MSHRKRRVVIYDFDGTLFYSPDRETGERRYFEATGRKFGFEGWWGREESLIPPIVPDRPSEEWWVANTIAAYRRDASDENTEVVLMTGRPFKHSPRVIELCEQNGLKFHSHYFRGQPGQQGRDTLEVKSNFIKQDIMHRNLAILEIWEDRPEHVSSFVKLAQGWRENYSNLEQVVIHDVSGPKHFL